MPVARFPEMPAAAEKPVEPKSSIAAAWETAFGVVRPRNDLMSAVRSANSTPATTWDAAFKVHTPVARFPEMPAAAEKPVKPEATITADWETAFGVARPRNDLMHAAQSANLTPATTWDAAFKVHMPVARFPEMPAVEKPVKSEASIAAAWETAFGVARPRNDLMHAVQSANSTPATTWDAAFKVHMPVARFPEMPAVEKPVKSEASIAAA